MPFVKFLLSGGHIARRHDVDDTVSQIASDDKQIPSSLRTAVQQVIAISAPQNQRPVFARFFGFIRAYLMRANVLDVLFIPFKITNSQALLPPQGYLYIQKMSSSYPLNSFLRNLKGETGGSVSNKFNLVNNNLIINQYRSEARQTAKAYFDFLKKYSPAGDGASFENTWHDFSEEDSTPLLKRLGQQPPVGGIGVSVGPDQNFGFIGMLNPEQWFIIDLNRKITEIMIPGILGLTEYADTPEAFATLLNDAGSSFWKTYIQEIYPSDIQRHAILFWENVNPKVRALLIEKWSREGGWLSSPQLYRVVKQAWKEGRIRGISGNWSKGAPRNVAAVLRESGKAARVFYLSNIDSWNVQADPAIFENLQSIPREEASFVVDRHRGGTSHNVFRLYDFYELNHRHLLKPAYPYPFEYYLSYGLHELAEINSGIEAKGAFEDALYFLENAVNYFPETKPDAVEIVRKALAQGLRADPLKGVYGKALGAFEDFLKGRSEARTDVQVSDPEIEQILAEIKAYASYFWSDSKTYQDLRNRLENFPESKKESLLKTIADRKMEEGHSIWRHIIRDVSDEDLLVELLDHPAARDNASDALRLHIQNDSRVEEKMAKFLEKFKAIFSQEKHTAIKQGLAELILIFEPNNKEARHAIINQPESVITVEKVMPILYKKAAHGVFAHYGLRFEYALLQPEDYEQLTGIRERFWVKRWVAETGGAFIEWNMRTGTREIFVAGSAFPERFQEIAALHEYVETIFKGSHEAAILAELEMARRQKKLSGYLSWLEEQHPKRYQDLLKLAQKAPKMILEKIQRDDSIYPGRGNKAKAKAILKLIRNFKWPEALLRRSSRHRSDRDSNNRESPLGRDDHRSEAREIKIRLIDFLRRIDSKYGTRRLLEGGPVQSPEWFVGFKSEETEIARQSNVSDHSYQDLPGDQAPLRFFDEVAEEIEKGTLKLPLVYKPNGGSDGAGLFFLEQNADGQTVLTVNRTQGVISNFLNPEALFDYLESHPAVDRKMEGEQIVSYVFRKNTPLASLLREIRSRTIFPGAGVYDAGMMESYYSTALKPEGFAFETRFVFEGLLGKDGLLFVPSDEIEAQDGGSQTFSRWGANPYLANYAGRSGAQILGGEDLYRPLFNLYPEIEGRQQEFENYVQELLQKEWSFLSQKLGTMGLQDSPEVLGYFDLMWLPPNASSKGFPVPALVEMFILPVDLRDLYKEITLRPDNPRSEVRSSIQITEQDIMRRAVDIWQQQGDLVLPPDSDWGSAFARPAAPLYIEIGAAKGHHLLKLASRRPDANFIGIEPHLYSFFRMAEKVRRSQLSNVRLVFGRDAEVLKKARGNFRARMIFTISPDPRQTYLFSKNQKEDIRFLTDRLSPDGVFLAIPFGSEYQEWLEEIQTRLPAAQFDFTPRIHAWEKPQASTADAIQIAKLADELDEHGNDRGRVFDGMILIRPRSDRDSNNRQSPLGRDGHRSGFGPYRQVRSEVRSHKTGEPYKITLTPLGENKWKSQRENDGAAFEFMIQEAPIKISNWTKDHQADVSELFDLLGYRRYGSVLDKARDKWGNVGNWILILTENKVVGFYHHSRQTNNIDMVIVHPKYRGTGAVDVLFEDIRQRLTQGKSGQKFKAYVARKSPRATNDEDWWTIDELKEKLGVNSIVTIHPAAEGKSEMREVVELGKAKRPMTIMMSRETVARMSGEEFTAFYKVYAGRSEIRKVLYEEQGKGVPAAPGQKQALEHRLTLLKQMGGVVESREDGAGAMKHGIPNQPFFYINEEGLPKAVAQRLRREILPQVWGVRLKKGFELVAVPLIFEPGSSGNQVRVEGQDIVGMAAFQQAQIQEWMNQQVVGWSA